MIEIKAPNPYDINEQVINIFLGGSIEMGVAENWQEKIVSYFNDYENVRFLNPRRDNWDSSWKQTPIKGTQFYEQVKWELDAQCESDIIIYNFCSNTISPITLLELGGYGRVNNKKVFVCCPPDYFRYGNVVMFCKYFGIYITEDFQELIDTIKKEVEKVSP
jgi:hypothetical protein